MNRLDLFQDLVKFRIASYPLQDRNLLKDDYICGIEERILFKEGIMYDEYQNWLREEESIEEVEAWTHVVIKV